MPPAVDATGDHRDSSNPKIASAVVSMTMPIATQHRATSRLTESRTANPNAALAMTTMSDAISMALTVEHDRLAAYGVRESSASCSAAGASV
jgi:hypothetical protein